MNYEDSLSEVRYMKRIFITFMILSITVWLSLDVNAKKKKDNFSELKQQLVDGAVAYDKIYDVSDNYKFDEAKEEKLIEAWRNSIDNTKIPYNTMYLDQFYYQENKELFKKIRNTEYYILALNIQLQDTNYNFDKQKFILFHYTPVTKEYKNFYFFLGKGSASLTFNDDDVINIDVPIKEAKELTKDENICLLILIKQNGLEDNGSVLDIKVIRAMLINGKRNKIYKAFNDAKGNEQKEKDGNSQTQE